MATDLSIWSNTLLHFPCHSQHMITTAVLLGPLILKGNRHHGFYPDFFFKPTMYLLLYHRSFMFPAKCITCIVFGSWGIQKLHSCEPESKWYLPLCLFSMVYRGRKHSFELFLRAIGIIFPLLSSRSYKYPLHAKAELETMCCPVSHHSKRKPRKVPFVNFFPDVEYKTATSYVFSFPSTSFVIPGHSIAPKPSTIKCQTLFPPIKCRILILPADKTREKTHVHKHHRRAYRRILWSWTLKRGPVRLRRKQAKPCIPVHIPFLLPIGCYRKCIAESKLQRKIRKLTEREKILWSTMICLIWFSYCCVWQELFSKFLWNTMWYFITVQLLCRDPSGKNNSVMSVKHLAHCGQYWKVK